jgi:YfiR/HmsC-like
LSCIGLVVVALLFSGAWRSSAQTGPTKEYQVKAVFLFNFAQFVEWPTNAFPGPQTPLVIGVLGDDPFGPFLDATVRGETVNGHPLVIQRYHRVNEIKECHILFISQSESGRLTDILSGLKGRNILTVGDFEGFAQQGGIVRFVTDKKIRLRINVDAAKAANLTISSKLLRPSEIVESGKN